MTYANPRSTLAVSIVLPILAVITVSLRLYCRTAHKTPKSWDDWLIVPAMVRRPSARQQYQMYPRFDH